MTLAARARRFYWKYLRRYRYEICGNPGHRHGTIRRGCGRPVGVVWRAPTGIWNYVVASQDVTAYTVRKGAAGGPREERAEGVGGTLCLDCFTRFAEEQDIFLSWESRPL